MMFKLWPHYADGWSSTPSPQWGTVDAENPELSKNMLSCLKPGMGQNLAMRASFTANLYLPGPFNFIFSNPLTMVRCG